VNRQALDDLKQQIPLLGYLQAHDWRPARPLSRGRWMGLCPLHDDRQPSFLVDPDKNLFYCYGCGRGGDVIRFAELYHEVRFPQAVALLHQWRGLPPLLHEAAGFYRMQLHRHSEAVAYLYQRGLRSPELIEHMQIGYAPGGCLRAWLMQLGYSLQTLRQACLVTASGYDAYIHRVVFPLDGNLYGRSLSATAPRHRFLPGAKGACTHGSRSGSVRKRFSWRVCLITPCCGRPAFTTSPARWELSSTHTSFVNCAMVCEPSIWPLMPTPTAAGSVPRKRSRTGLENND